MPLVLVHNDVVSNPAHRWDDVEGVHYQYPSKYRGKIKTGEPFVYYRGVHRVGGKRGQAEYVGAGRIGQIWQDSNNEERSRAAWYCAIDDYHRFPVAVPAKIDNATLENIPRNMWRDGVRVLEPGVYERIMKLAEGGAADAPSTASADDVQAIASESLIVPKRLLAPSSDNGPGKIYRVSRRAKEVGDWAEKVVTEYLMATIAGCTNCIHRPTLGETPGWDIDYLDSAGELQRVEVKGTTAAAFTGVEMTSNELDAAMKYKEAYWLYLVAACLTRAPKIQAIQNPAAMFDSGAWSARPALFSIRFLGSGTE